MRDDTTLDSDTSEPRPPGRRRNTPFIPTTEQSDETLAWIVANHATTTHDPVAITAKTVAAGMQLPYVKVCATMAALAASGRLVQIGPRIGYLLPQQPSHTVTGSDLLALARCAHNPALRGTPGRPTDVGPRAVHELTTRQLANASAAMGVVARALTGDRTRVDLVGAEHFAWEGDDTVGRWALVARVAQWSDEAARAGHPTPADGRGGPGVRRDDNPAHETHTGGIRVLLDLAATHGLITRESTAFVGEAVAPSTPFDAYAPAWQPWLQAAYDSLDASTLAYNTRHVLRGGLRQLARVATALGYGAPERTDWSAVVSTFQTDAELDKLLGSRMSDGVRRAAQGAYRRLLAAGTIEGPPWGIVRRAPVGLVETADVRRAAEEGDFSAWRLPAPLDGERLITELADWRTWADARVTDAQLVDLGLPRRTYYDPTDRQRVYEARCRKNGRALFAVRPSSLCRYMSQLNAYIGAIARGPDAEALATRGLAAITDPEVHSRYCDAYLKATGRPVTATARVPWLSALAKILATIASPFLAARAEAGGDVAAARLHKAQGGELLAAAMRLAPKESEVCSGRTKVAAWEQGGTDGYSKLDVMIDLMVVDVVARAGDLTIEQQIDAVASGRLAVRSPLQWSTRMRDAVMFSLGRRLPLRGGNATALRPAELSPPCPKFWIGNMGVDLGAATTKTDVPFRASILSEGDMLDASAVEDARRLLWQLWLMPGGGRDTLNRALGRVPAEVAFVFPSSGRRTDMAVGGRYGVRSFTATIKRLLHRYGARAGIDVAAVLATYGAGASHIFRHLLGTELTRSGAIERGGYMLLGHLGPATARQAYSGETAVTFSLDAALRERRLAAATDNDEGDCPYCAERIKRRAVKCKHCGEALAA